MTLVETLIVLTFFGFVGSLVTLAVSAKARAQVKAALGFAAPMPPAPGLDPRAPERPNSERPSSVRTNSEQRAEALRSGALHWLHRRSESACPTIADVLGDGQGQAATAAVDEWGHPFELSCEGEEVYAHSAGPDGVRDSDDDVVAPAPAPAFGTPTPLPRPVYVHAPWVPGDADPPTTRTIRPERISGDDPVNAPEAQRAGVGGKASVKCVITTEGVLRDCRIIKGLASLDGAILKALATQRYKPVYVRGRPTEVEHVFTFNFPPR